MGHGQSVAGDVPFLAKSASLSVAVLVDFLVASPRLIRHLT